MASPISSIEKRKREHLELCATKDVSFKQKTTLFEEIELNYKCLPELSQEEIDLGTNFLGKKFTFPFMVSSMTGGAQAAKKVNKELAEACQEVGVGMGLGSMRAMLRQPSLMETYYVRDVAPDIFLSGNIGVAQLKEYSAQQLEEALQAVEADALAIHCNAAQEAVQAGGDADFSGLLELIAQVSDTIKLPVIVKEVGHGISYEVALALRELNIKAIATEGAGGTSWVAIDSIRSGQKFTAALKEFGIPTAVSVIEVKRALLGTNKKIIASGGVRDGIDAIKGIVLGADLAANAIPVFRAQQKKGSAGAKTYLENMHKEMRIAAFLIGCKDIAELHEEKAILSGKIRTWLER